MNRSKTTAVAISNSEMEYREGKKNELIMKMQSLLGKTREQILELFRFYANRALTGVVQLQPAPVPVVVTTK